MSGWNGIAVMRCPYPLHDPAVPNPTEPALTSQAIQQAKLSYYARLLMPMLQCAGVPYAEGACFTSAQFRFNVREVEMGTRRPLIVQMVHDPTAKEVGGSSQATYVTLMCAGGRLHQS